MKKSIYIGLTMVLCFLLTLTAHLVIGTLIPLGRLSALCFDSKSALLDTACLLHWWSAYTIPIISIVGGYFVGQLWWRLVYIEGRHFRWHRKKE